MFTLPEESFVVSFNPSLSCREHGRGKYMIVFITQIGNVQLQMKEKVALYTCMYIFYWFIKQILTFLEFFRCHANQARQTQKVQSLS